MLCEKDPPPPTKSTAPSTPITTSPPLVAAVTTEKTKKKKKAKKKKKFSDLMAEMMQGSAQTPEAAGAAHRQKIARHLGGGTFSKLDKI